MENYLQPWKRYADFSGRASRAEYWTFVLINFVISLILQVLAVGAEALALLSLIFSLVTLIPTIAAGVRRMHDTGHSGWYILVPIYNLILGLTEGDDGTNDYGPNPYDDPEGPNLEDHFVA